MWSIRQVLNYLIQSTALWCREYYQAIYNIYLPTLQGYYISVQETLIYNFWLLCGSYKYKI